MWMSVSVSRPGLGVYEMWREAESAGEVLSIEGLPFYSHPVSRWAQPEGQWRGSPLSYEEGFRHEYTEMLLGQYRGLERSG